MTLEEAGAPMKRDRFMRGESPLAAIPTRAPGESTGSSHLDWARRLILIVIIEQVFYCVKGIFRRYRKWGCPTSTPLPVGPNSRRPIRSQPKALPSEKLGTSIPDDHSWPPSQRFRFLSVIGIYSRDFMSSWQGLACELPSFRKPLSNCRVVQ